MRHGMPAGGKDVIVPFPKAALNTPAIAVDMVAGPEKRQLSAQAPHIIILTCVELKLGHQLCLRQCCTSHSFYDSLRLYSYQKRA